MFDVLQPEFFNNYCSPHCSNNSIVSPHLASIFYFSNDISPQFSSVPSSCFTPSTTSSVSRHQDMGMTVQPQCWDHGCNGRPFSTNGNLKRHQREKSENCEKHICEKCGRDFTRVEARNKHAEKDICNRDKKVIRLKSKRWSPITPYSRTTSHSPPGPAPNRYAKDDDKQVTYAINQYVRARHA